jgi:hypothetical protein
MCFASHQHLQRYTPSLQPDNVSEAMGRAIVARAETILLVATSESKLGDTNIPTGAW